MLLGLSLDGEVMVFAIFAKKVMRLVSSQKYVAYN